MAVWVFGRVFGFSTKSLSQENSKERSLAFQGPSRAGLAEEVKDKDADETLENTLQISTSPSFAKSHHVFGF